MAVANKNKNNRATSNVYTALLALSCGIVLATAVYVAILCYTQYETLFKVTGPN